MRGGEGSRGLRWQRWEDKLEKERLKKQGGGGGVIRCQKKGDGRNE